MPSFLSPQWMLIYGLFLSFFIQKQPQVLSFSKTWSKRLLQFSIVLLGSKLNIEDLLGHGLSGIFITFTSLFFVFFFGWLLNKFFNLAKIQAALITVGTAICGGSAIAAIAPLLKASGGQIALSMGVVFLLNAIAIFIFPPLGHWLAFDQEQFGLFSALAIHDTSSVVAASSVYGDKAMELATTYKLTRALWIIPISIFFSIIYSNLEGDSYDSPSVKNWKKKVKVPTFILGFIATSTLFSFFDSLSPLRPTFVMASKIGLSLTLALIGLGMNLSELKRSGLKSLLYGICLWFMTIISSIVIVKLR